MRNTKVKEGEKNSMNEREWKSETSTEIANEKETNKKKQELHKGIETCTNRETEKRSINKGTKIRID